jgi:hypothetical protein
MDTDVSFPGSFEDAAKSIKHIFKILDEIVRRGRGAVEVYRTHRRRSLASNLDHLRFGEGGSLTYLARILQGKYDHRDIEALRRQMADTEDPMTMTVKRLKKYRNKKFIREQLGIDALILLEQILDAPGGKGDVREGIWHLITHGTQEEGAQEFAQALLDDIETLNRNIIDLHNLLLRRRARIARKAKAVTKKEPKGKKSRGQPSSHAA